MLSSSSPAAPAFPAPEAQTSSVTISPALGQRSLWGEAQELWRYRHLVRTLVERDLRVRYKNSVLGVAWTLVNPIISVLVLTFAIGYILGSGPKNLSAYIFCATVPWTFFSSAVLDSSTAVLAKLGLLKKVYFPREIPLIATVCQNFVQFLIMLGVFCFYRWVLMPLAYGGWSWPPAEILWLPVVAVLLFLLTLGVSFFISAANVFYEDVKFIVSISMSFLFYLTPIIYFAENIVYSARLNMDVGGQVGGHSFSWWIYHLYLANPLAWIVTAFKQMFFARAVISNRGATDVLSAPFDYRYFLIATVLSVGICVGGYAFFNSRKWKFTERP